MHVRSHFKSEPGRRKKITFIKYKLYFTWSAKVHYSTYIGSGGYYSLLDAITSSKHTGIMTHER